MSCPCYRPECWTVRGSSGSVMMWGVFCCHGLGPLDPLEWEGHCRSVQSCSSILMGGVFSRMTDQDFDRLRPSHDQNQTVYAMCITDLQNVFGLEVKRFLKCSGQRQIAFVSRLETIDGIKQVSEEPFMGAKRAKTWS